MKVLLACGGTGGHIFPAVSVAEELRLRDPRTEVLYVCGKKDIEEAIFKIISGARVFSVDGAGFRGARSLWDPIFLIKCGGGLAASFAILRRERPDIVVGFGGHFSFPVVAAARFLGIPTLIHEQNVVPGVANKFLSRIATGVALSFEDTRRYLKSHPRIRVTGNPIRASIERARRDEALGFFGFDPARRTLLVLGGSQGSESINTVFLETLREMPREMRDRLQILHLCGQMPVREAEAGYREASVPAKVTSFFDRMDMAYAASDLALGRAGATFLAEAKSRGLPVILVPYPFAGGHQQMNAEIFAREREALIIPQDSLNSRSLRAGLEKYLDAPLGPGARDPEISAARARLTDFIEALV